jgi:hypothetical protein
MKYERFLRGNSSNFRTMKGLTQALMLANTKVYMGGYGITHQIKKNTLLLLSVVMILMVY